MRFSYAEQLEAAEREVAQRKRVYARQVDNKKMSQAFAERQIALMETIAETLGKLAKGDKLL